jgi:S1-C subfamily serine protease
VKRATLYSSSSRTQPAGRPSHAGQAEGAIAEPSAPRPEPAEQRAGPPSTHRGSLRRRLVRGGRPLLLAAGALCALAVAIVLATRTTVPRAVTQEDIDAAVLRTLETQQLPSRTAKAYEVIRPSVVRVRGMVTKKKQEEKDAKQDAKKDDKKEDKRAEGSKPDRKGADSKAADGKPAESEEIEQGVGTGVVIVDKGIILTNLHVVAGAERVKVVFADGMESDAEVIGLRPEHDLAVLQARTVPDDLTPATMRSTSDLQPGDEVVAVGFPFGIGPSASAGVISGLRREFRSEEGQRVLTNLIQFDAAANPGSSGGPLVTLDGAVIGIVTAILNPSEQRVFIGIGFAVPIENAASAAGMPPF